MKTIGLVFSSTQLTVVEYTTPTDWQVTTVGQQELASVIALLQQNNRELALVLSSPMIYRKLELPFTAEKKIRQVLPLQLETQLPNAFERYAYRLVLTKQTEQTSVFTTLIDQTLITEQLHLLSEHGFSPRVVQPGLLLRSTIHTQTPVEAPLIYLWLGELETGIVYITAEQNIQYAFTIPIGYQHITHKQSLANLRNRIFATLHHVPNRWQIQSCQPLGPEVVDYLLESVVDRTIDLVPLDDSFQEYPADVYLAYLGAQALAKRQKPLWNLAAKQSLLSKKILKNPAVRRYAIPIALAIVLTLAGFMIKTHSIRAQAENLRSQMDVIYSRNFPKSRVIDPLRQMRSVAERASGEGRTNKQGSKIIQKFQDFSQAISNPTMFDIRELRVAGANWTVRGQTQDFGSVDELKQRIDQLPWADNVQVERAEQTADQKAVRFQITWLNTGGL